MSTTIMTKSADNSDTITPELKRTAKELVACGSIEMGAAEDWQSRLTQALVALDLFILNPRRDDTALVSPCRDGTVNVHRHARVAFHLAFTCTEGRSA